MNNNINIMNKNSKNNSVSENDEFKNTTKNIIFKPKEVKISNIDVSDLKEEGATQPLAYINYKDDKRNIDTKLLVQTGMIKLTGHGIPQLHEQFYPTDDKREFIKIPLDPEQEACNELRDMLEKVDQHFGSNEMKERLFGPKKAKKYEYQPCIRTQTNNDDDEDDEKSKTKKDKKSKPTYPRYDFVKMKFSVINENDKRVIKTKMTKIEGKNKTKFIPQSIKDIANEITFKSNIRLIFYFNKVWANTTSSPGSKVILYGLGFKVIAMEYQSNVGKGIDPSSIDFRSDDEEPTNVKNNKTSKNIKENDNGKNTKSKNKKYKDEENEDTSENSVDENVKKIKNEDNISDEDVDDNEENEDSQDEKSEEEIPVKKVKKMTKKVDSDEEEEIKPTKKTRAKTSK